MTNSTATATPVDHGHILVVDDDPQIRLLVSRFLQRHGYRVSSAPDGRVMQEMMARSPVDLVILDVMLPGKSGLDLCREARVSTQVPIIMLTARGDEGDRIAGLEVGADDYVTKPFSSRELLARVRAVLRRMRGRSASSEPVPKGLSDWGTRDSKGLFRPSWSERCGPQPLAGSIVARDFDMKRI